MLEIMKLEFKITHDKIKKKVLVCYYNLMLMYLL